MLNKEVLLKDIEIRAKALALNGIGIIDRQGYTLYARDGNRAYFEKQYFFRRQQLSIIGLALLQEKNVNLLSFYEDLLWEICNEYTWALPPHLEEQNGVKVESNRSSRYVIDLFAAETAQALAEITEFLGDLLSKEIIERVKEEIKDRIWLPLFSQKFPWKEMTNNWSGVIGSCLGMTAISMYGKKREKVEKVLDRIDACFTSFLSGFNEDGACVEGVGYWSYGFGYYCYFAEKYARIYCDERYFRCAKLKAIAEFPWNIELFPNQYVPYSDVSQDEVPSGLLSFCQKYFGVNTPAVTEYSGLDFDHCYRWAHLSRNLWWTILNKKQLGTKSVYLKDVQWMIETANNFSFSFKGGGNDEPHNHNDVGSFILGDKNELFLTDIGAGQYTRDYFDDEKRYTILNARSLGHSVPIIGGNEQRHGSFQSQLENIDLLNKEACIELTNLYPSEARLNEFCRTFKWNSKTRSVTVKDEIKMSLPFSVVENFVSWFCPTIEGGMILWEGKKNKLELSNIENANVKITPKQFTAHDGNIKKVYLLEIEYFAEQNILLNFKLRKKEFS